jgi:hypothetical protein
MPDQGKQQQPQTGQKVPRTEQQKEKGTHSRTLKVSSGTGNLKRFPEHPTQRTYGKSNWMLKRDKSLNLIF